MVKKLLFVLLIVALFPLFAATKAHSPIIPDNTKKAAQTKQKKTCPTPQKGMTKRELRKIKSCVKRNDPNRMEWAILPVIGFNSDIGFIFGGNVVFAQFDEKRDLYKWRIALLGSAAVNSDGISMQNHAIQFDMPQIAGSKWRLQMRAAYIEIDNKGYYGFGNDAPYISGEDKDRYTYSVQSPEAWAYTTYTLPKKMSLLGGLRFRYSLFDFSPSSLLDDHQQAVDIPGTEDHGELVWALGWNLDTRDDETATTSGYFLQLSTRFSIGPITGTDYNYGATSIQGRGFIPVAKEYLVFASRVFFDIMYGDAPFYEMSIAGAFPYFDMPGGSRGIRGVPEGRYRGPVKLIINLEVRSMFIKFNLGSQRFKIGAVAFFDTGRIWMYQDYSYLDGDGMGMKFGVGGGVRLQWGKTVMVRIDVAYSPDSDPIGFYFDVGHMF